MKFIDLFAGLGGFHVALEKLGHECVFASEKKENLANLYAENFSIEVNRDITKIKISEIPKFNILCAGFPCQPFSKAGDQFGLNDKKNGNLFDKIVEILDYHKPEYFILENVRNLKSHDNFATWKYIKNKLEKSLGYTIDDKIMSPHNYGIPQHRERIFIIGSRTGLNHFEWPKSSNSTDSIFNFLEKNPTNATKLESEKMEVLKLWQEFIEKIPPEDNLPSFPIWSMEFGATYPFEKEIPFRASSNALGRSKGKFGIPLKGMTREEKFQNLPNYVKKNQVDEKGHNIQFPNWKKHYIRSNRSFYKKYEKELAPVVEKIQKLGVSSWQKFEWNVKGGERDLSKYIIQFRGSGVRVKKTDFFPSLVTVSTQIPILSWENRYITPREGAKIQSLNGIKLPENLGSCFSALGNAVNSKLVELIAFNLIIDDENPNLKTKLNSIKEVFESNIPVLK
ncbi:DNA (cytosine-5)-methyltransferase 1 [Nonlabens dokdonensis]|uniref:Cytosine-specific methyltransferase n=2 Tax=Nonlabens dokdonensis TaxID=328515 RepID=L7WEI9_NONDD|nr:DNA (cytosine-5-)-methyltransferase [Nonlabens dokdonensis]AGC78321.1 cytosine-specific DNA methylase [Nonlabens dokdonensis DSW-6]PZX37794.1 DNA (cytosine-5)-methyltransferase 1 [Nonlabens dokdonensis]